MNPSTQRLIRYGAGVALALVVVVGAFYFFDRSGTATPATTAQRTNPTATAPSTAAAKPAKAATAAANPDEAAVPSAAQTDQVARLLGDARRLAQNGDFAGAKAALDKADAVMPGSADTAAVRRDVAQMSTPQGQLALQLDRARSAIAQDDRAAAERRWPRPNGSVRRRPRSRRCARRCRTRSRRKRSAAAVSPRCWRRCATPSHATTSRPPTAPSTRPSGSTSAIRRSSRRASSSPRHETPRKNATPSSRASSRVGR